MRKNSLKQATNPSPLLAILSSLMQGNRMCLYSQAIEPGDNYRVNLTPHDEDSFKRGMEILQCSLVNVIKNTLVSKKATPSSLFLTRFLNSVDGGICIKSPKTELNCQGSWK
jgi:hypothetical protein